MRAATPIVASVIWVRTPSEMPVAAAIPVRMPPEMDEAMTKTISMPGVRLSKMPAVMKAARIVGSMAVKVV